MVIAKTEVYVQFFIENNQIKADKWHFIKEHQIV